MLGKDTCMKVDSYLQRYSYEQSREDQQFYSIIFVLGFNLMRIEAWILAIFCLSLNSDYAKNFIDI